MKVNGHCVPCVQTPPSTQFYSDSFQTVQMYRCPDHELKICMWFEYNPQINV